MRDEKFTGLFLSRSQWRQEGRAVKPKSEPSLTREYRKKQVNLYAFSQTTKLGPRAIARNYLVDLFGNYPESFGYRPKDGDDICRVQSEWFKGGARSFLERGFNYKLCKRGIRIGREKWAESFHIPAGPVTRFAVCDLDNHLPTLSGTEVHLELVARIQDRLPVLIRNLGIQSTFWQYRTVTPTGIQLWLVSTPERDRQPFHDKIRQFLVSLGTDDLDKRLRANGLPGLEDIEILPGGKLVSMPGCYGKLVFTDHELKITNQRFDCEGLYRHIKERRKAANVLDRYRELVMVRDFEEETRSKWIPAPPVLIPRRNHRREDGNGYWSRLKRLCQEGVTRPDCLHVSVLQPLAQALLFREFHDRADKKEVCFRVLRDWILRHHNGLVSRIGNKKVRSLESQIRSTIRNTLKKPCPNILDYYAKMRIQDRRYPHRVESLLSLMGAGDHHRARYDERSEIYPFPEAVEKNSEIQESDTTNTSLINCKGCISKGREISLSPEMSEKNSKQQAEDTTDTSLIYCKGCISVSISSHSAACGGSTMGLPVSIYERLEAYSGQHVRRGKATTRFQSFAAKFILAIGASGSRELNEKILLRLAGKEADADKSFLQRWKNHLVSAGILKAGWADNIIRNVRSSKYQLAAWVVADLNGKAPHALQEGRLEVKGGVSNPDHNGGRGVDQEGGEWLPTFAAINPFKSHAAVGSYPHVTAALSRRGSPDPPQGITNQIIT